MTDSAGRPWSGRAFEPSPWVADDGSAPAAYAAALGAFRSGAGPVEAVVDSLRSVRLLVPLLADLGDGDRSGDDPQRHGGPAASHRSGAGGRRRGADLALVTVAGPDGRRVLPAFSSAAEMAAWNPAARPVPAPARQVALGAAGDGTELVIVDPGSPARFGLRRSALEALARDLPWTAPWRDESVLAAFRRGVAAEGGVERLSIESGDPLASLAGAEVRVVVILRDDLQQASRRDLLARVQRRWLAEEAVRLRVDSLAVAPAGPGDTCGR